MTSKVQVLLSRYLLISLAESESERNVIRFRVLKSRFTGLTGSAGSAIYNHKTSRLTATGGFDFVAIGD